MADLPQESALRHNRETAMNRVHAKPAGNNPVKDNKANILFSLQYLSREAMSSGYSYLHSVLEAALTLAARNSKGPGISSDRNACDADAESIMHFLTRYQNAPVNIRVQVLEAIERFELHKDA